METEENVHVYRQILGLRTRFIPKTTQFIHHIFHNDNENLNCSHIKHDEIPFLHMRNFSVIYVYLRVNVLVVQRVLEIIATMMTPLNLHIAKWVADVPTRS